MSELRQREPRDRVEITIRPGLDTKPIKGVVRRRQTVDQKRAVPAPDDIRLLTFHVWQSAGNGLKQVGLGDNAFETSVLVENDREPDRRLLEPLQHCEDRHRLMDDQRLADNGQRVERLAIEGLVEEIRFQNHAQWLVDTAPPDEKLLGTG